MTALQRKLLRDLWRLRSQVGSIAAVVACGVASVIAMRSTLDSIQRTRDEYYASARFPDVFATVKRAPEEIAQRIAAIPGVSIVETRVTASALLQLPRRGGTAQGYVASVPANDEPLLNALHIRSGRFLAPASVDEVLINEHFANANALRAGDSIAAVINGHWNRFHIVGIALSPEFIHDASPGVGQFADSKQHGILWMRRNAVESLYDMDGAFDDVALLLGRTASENAVIDAVDAILRRYGGGRAFGRADQPSNRVVEGEIEQLRVFGTAMPLIFLSVAAFLLNVVLSRLVATQREEIATLKAFGYGNLAIGRHFLAYPIAAVTLGSIGGVALGVWVGGMYTELYAHFFRFPRFAHYTSPSLTLAAILVSALAAIAGALGAVRGAVALAPAEGMKPSTPMVFRPLLLERLGFGALLPPALNMMLRNMERRPFRTLSSIIGVAFAAAILVVGSFAFDSARYMSDLQFRQAEREDLSVVFTDVRPARVRYNLASIDGVSRVELFRAAPVRIRSRHHSRQIALMGLESGAELRRLIDRDGQRHGLPRTGGVLTTTLARILEVHSGDTVTLELLEHGNEFRQEIVAAELDELLGLGGYMQIDALNRMMSDGPVASGAYLRTRSSEHDVIDHLSRLPRVAYTTTRRAMLESFDRQIAESLRLTVTIVISLAAVVALGVIYNGIRISLSERTRELASLRVLGFTRGEVAALLFGEHGIVDVLGTALGLGLGLALAHWMISGFETELYRFPVIVSARTNLLAVAVILVAAVGTSLVMRRRIDRLDLVAALKTRE